MATTTNKTKAPALEPLTAEQCRTAIEAIDRATLAAGRQDLSATDVRGWLGGQMAASERSDDDVDPVAPERDDE